MSENREETKTAEKDKSVDSEQVEDRRTSWWWGVIPAVTAGVILVFWLTGQSEEIFGIDPRGSWVAETIMEVGDEAGRTGGPALAKRVRIRWKLLISDVAGERWLKLYKNNREVLAGPLSVEENALMYRSARGYFHAIYFTTAVRFRYNPFAPRHIDAVIRLHPGEAYSVVFKRM
jgi:hypothetical protein